MKLIYMNSAAEMKVWIPKQAISKGATVAAECPNCGFRQAVDAGMATKYSEANCAVCGMTFPIGFLVPDANLIMQNKQARFMFYLN